jgi:L,D-peptidoglycan transpeptidase YkuD (ErfK/YbiS/YcfS/YnhG family)
VLVRWTPPATAAPPTITTSTTSATTTSTPATTVVRRAVQRVPPPATVARRTTTTAAPAPRRAIVEDMRGLGGSEQVVTVTAPAWGSSRATLQAFEKDGTGAWHTVVGPTAAFVGANGFAVDKREGDRRTPAGMYGFQSTFGTAPDPGTRLEYRTAGPGDVWVDDPASALYNTWQREPADGRWASAERLDQPAPYEHAAVIAYNVPPVAGKGSAIFLHVTLGHGTAGCVAVPGPVVVQLLQWLDPARQPLIAMGPESYVRRL